MCHIIQDHISVPIGWLDKPEFVPVCILPHKPTRIQLSPKKTQLESSVFPGNLKEENKAQKGSVTV